MIRAAILDMYDGTPNLGLASILEIIEEKFPEIKYEVFNVRGKGLVPDMSFDIYISSGGPGNPLEYEEHWSPKYSEWLDNVWNSTLSGEPKHVFFICHSFQLACQHFKIGTVNRRPEESFGIFKMEKALGAETDPLFKYLPQPFYSADFRKYQVVEPDIARLEAMGARILAREHPSTHDFDHRAVTAIRFHDTIYGVQFHPEAYPDGMLEHFRQPDRKAMILKQFGNQQFEEMMFQLRDPIKIGLTYDKVLPGFLRFATNALSSSAVLV